MLTPCPQVFNLVTQQDAATSTTIARETKADGSAMRVIATLTMVFLPGTFTAALFGMSILDHAHWWLYVAVTLSLSLVVLVGWYIWQKLDDLSDFYLKLKRRRTTDKEHIV